MMASRLAFAANCASALWTRTVRTSAMDKCRVISIVLFRELAADHIQRSACLEPAYLLFIIGMVDAQLVLAAILVMQYHGQGFAWGKRCQAIDIDDVILLHLVIVFFIRKGQRQHALFFQIGLMDAGKAADDYRAHAEMTGLHSCMLAAAAFAIILIADDHRSDMGSLIVPRGGRDRAISTRELILDVIGVIVEKIDGTDQHVVGDIVEMTAEFQPRTRHGDMIGGTLALGFDQEFQPLQVGAFPGCKRREELQPPAVGFDHHLYILTVFRRGLV